MNEQPSIEALVAVATTQAPRHLTGADLESLLPLIRRFQGRGEPDMRDLLEALPEYLTALAQLLGLDRATLATLPLHALLQIGLDMLPAWLDLNARYITEQMTPVLQGLQQHLDAASASDK